ncbi:hypothetical protein [Sphingomonas sp. 67-36]|uniref:hypothetical protein n=1 Tax=Sphingomonas sp. 67-36 TaxID=1895849 RepID=UPI000927345A|nr:hypothetical protein [Sphingomonas sp. 67-36]OJV32233.1 MAG: hypothetical protein BGO24_15725 [Sphingomonas sp. 67-36]
MSGVIEPMGAGASQEFSRAERPKRYRASMGWNGLPGGFFIFFSGQLLIEAPIQALRDRCRDWKNISSPVPASGANPVGMIAPDNISEGTCGSGANIRFVQNIVYDRPFAEGPFR